MGSNSSRRGDNKKLKRDILAFSKIRMSLFTLPAYRLQAIDREPANTELGEEEE